MTVFGLNQNEIKNGYEEAERNVNNIPLESLATDSIDSDVNTPNFFSGALPAAGKGVQSAAVNLMALTGKTGFDFGLDMKPEEMQKAAVEINKGLQPDPAVTGWLGSHVIYPLTKVLTEAVPATILAGPVGGAAVVGGTEGSTEYERLKSEGVDESTALKVGAVTGITQGGGFLAPAAIAGNILTRLGSGAAINAVIGGAQRGSTGKILDDAGYSEMADQYKVLDKSAALTDVILGAAFGAFHGIGKGREKPLPSEVDTAFAANNINQYEIDAAPGIPADLQTRNSHVAAMDEATRQLLNNEQVNVADHFDNPNFVPKEHNPEIAEGLHVAIKEEGIDKLEIEPSNEIIKIPDNIINQPIKDLMDDSLNLLREGGIAPKFEAQKPITSSQYKEYTKIEGSIRDYVEGVVAELNEAREGERTFIAPKEGEGGAPEVVGIKSNFPEWLQELNKQGKAITREYVNNVAQKMYQGKPLGKKEIEVAENLYSEAQARREENTRGLKQQVEELELDLATMPNEQVKMALKEAEAAALREPTEEGMENIKLSEQIVKEKPYLEITDEDGNIMSAVDALTKADEEAIRAQQEVGLFDVAINCFIRNGDA